MGGLIAFGLSFFLIWFLKISNFEGGSGYFALFVILTGVAGGFFVRLPTVLSIPSRSVQIQLRATAIVPPLPATPTTIVVLNKAFEDKGPTLHADNITPQ